MKKRMIVFLLASVASYMDYSFAMISYVSSDNDDGDLDDRTLNTRTFNVSTFDARAFDMVLEMHEAVRSGNLDALYRLLNNGVDVNNRGKCRNTPLHTAVSNGDIFIINALLQAPGIDPNVSDTDGWTPLHVAVHGAYFNPKKFMPVIVRLLADQRVKINASMLSVGIRPGRTPLHFAACDGLVEVVGLLLFKKADINAVDAEGKTPLHVAVFHGHTLVVAALLAQEDLLINIVNGEGQTALHLAQSAGNEKLKHMLITAGADSMIPDGKAPKIPVVKSFRLRSASQQQALVTFLENVSKLDQGDGL